MRTCICEGGFIPFPEVADPTLSASETEAACSRAVVAFMRQVGTANEWTITEWVMMRKQAAVLLGLLANMEHGRVEVTGYDKDGPALFGLREAAA